MAGLTEDGWVFVYTSVINLLDYLFWLKYMKKI